MRVSNESGAESGGPFAELLRLQTDLQRRLGEETLNYLRRLQRLTGPVVPGTVVAPRGAIELGAEGPPGARVRLELELENRQRAHCMVSPLLAPLVERHGVTWFPEVEASPPSLLIAPGDTARLSLEIAVPRELPDGTYRGALILQGFRQGGIPVAIAVAGAKGGASKKAGSARPTGGEGKGGTRGGARKKRAKARSVRKTRAARKRTRRTSSAAFRRGGGKTPTKEAP